MAGRQNKQRYQRIQGLDVTHPFLSAKSPEMWAKWRENISFYYTYILIDFFEGHGLPRGDLKTMTVSKAKLGHSQVFEITSGKLFLTILTKVVNIHFIYEYRDFCHLIG